jgi:hypothetical protein
LPPRFAGTRATPACASDRQSNIFSVRAILYEMPAGRSSVKPPTTREDGLRVLLDRFSRRGGDVWMLEGF